MKLAIGKSYHSEPPPGSVEISVREREVLNFLLAIYIFFSTIESVESERDIPRYGDGNEHNFIGGFD